MNTCPRCSIEFSTAAIGGLCPACRLKQGMETAAAATASPDETIGDPPSPRPVPQPMSSEQLMALLPQFDQIELIGRGGMGVVYRARQKNLDRSIALKVLSPDVANSPGFAERFAREARAMARLSHPNIVAVHDFGVVDNSGVELCYFTMEFVDGSNLRGLLKQISSAQALVIIPQICEALQYAHDIGIVHRDIKPENILVDKKGRVKIADFGLAKLLQQAKTPTDYTLTRGDLVMGTPGYMAPEQLERPTQVDHRADLYSLGVVFYEMLTGQLPLGRFDLPSQKVEIDVRLDEVVLKALQREPERRYQQATEIKTGLENIAATPSRQSSAAPPIAPAVEAPPRQQSRTAVIGAVFSAIALAVGFALLILNGELNRASENHRFPRSVIGVVGLTLGIACGAAGLLMGWRATRQILRSAGQLRGLQPALFAGMLLPAIALAIAVGMIAGVGTMTLVATTLPGARVNPIFPAMMAGWITLALTALLVWRFARKHERK